MRKLEVRKTVVARPRIINFLISQDYEPPEDPAEIWGWVSVNELVNCLNEIVCGVKFDVKSNHVFLYFGLLNKEKDGKPLWTYIRERSPDPVENFSGDFHLHEDTDEIPDHEGTYVGSTFYIPSLWANNIIDLASTGMVCVKSQPKEVGEGYDLVVYNYSMEHSMILTKKGRGWRFTT